MKAEYRSPHTVHAVVRSSQAVDIPSCVEALSTSNEMELEDGVVVITTRVGSPPTRMAVTPGPPSADFVGRAGLPTA